MKKLAIFVVFILSLSCSKDEKGLKISITGFVDLIDESGNDLFKKDSIRVTVQGENISAITDQNGKYLFTGLEAGKLYSFDYTRVGYSSKSVLNQQFIGEGRPGLIGTVTLYQFPTTKLLNDTIENIGDYLYITGQTDSFNNLAVNVFLNDSDDVSLTHFDYQSYYHLISGYNMTYFNTYITIPQNSYPTGTTLWLAIYFYNYYEVDNSFSEKITSGKLVGVLKYTL